MIIQLKINVKVREELGMVTRNNKSVWATFDSCGMDSELKKGKGFTILTSLTYTCCSFIE